LAFDPWKWERVTSMFVQQKLPTLPGEAYLRDVKSSISHNTIVDRSRDDIGHYIFSLEHGHADVGKSLGIYLSKMDLTIFSRNESDQMSPAWAH
jgi:hypothetical protein